MCATNTRAAPCYARLHASAVTLTAGICGNLGPTVSSQGLQAKKTWKIPSYSLDPGAVFRNRRHCKEKSTNPLCWKSCLWCCDVIPLMAVFLLWISSLENKHPRVCGDLRVSPARAHVRVCLLSAKTRVHSLISRPGCVAGPLCALRSGKSVFGIVAG